MSSILINADIALGALGLPFEELLDLRQVRRLDLVVLVADSNRDGDSNLLNVAREIQEAGMTRKPCVNERLALDFGALGQEDGMLAAPAEPGGSDGESGALLLAKLLEEAFDDWERFADVIAHHKGDEPADDTDHMVSSNYLVNKLVVLAKQRLTPSSDSFPSR